MNQKDIIRIHAARYPAMRPIDAIKLVWQSEYGPGHLITDIEAAKERIANELMTLDRALPFSEAEDIGGGYHRFDLRALDFAPEILASMLAMPPERIGSESSFKQRLDILLSLAGEGVFSFSQSELEAEIARFRPIPSHSPEYRAAHHPSYRVIDSRFIKLLPIIRDVASRSGTVNIAIDGSAAAGKSTAGMLLSQALGCPLFHADDYFLTPELRTAERLSQAGGNIDYMRLKREITDNFGKSITYTPYDCSARSLGRPITVAASRINLLEGSYSQHPHFGQVWDIRIFCTVGPELQRKRILERNGPEMLRRFENEWIPMEKAYFEAFNIADKCDYLLDNGDNEC